jgi:hypothetical protein
MVKKLTIDWGEADKTPETRRRWLGSWLVSREGEEGDNFYDGLGGGETAHDVPPDAIGFRLRWWPPESQVDLNLEFGPLPTLAEDYFFSTTPEPTLAVAAMDLVR